MPRAKTRPRRSPKAAVAPAPKPLPHPAKQKIQAVLLSGEHTLLRAFLRAWLARFNRLQVVAEASSARHALEMIEKHKPTLLLMDFDILHDASIEFLAKIRAGHPKVKVLIYFAESNAGLALKVIRAGADGFVLKSADSEDMERAIKTVLSGGAYLSPGFLKSLGGPAALLARQALKAGPRPG